MFLKKLLAEMAINLCLMIALVARVYQVNFVPIDLDSLWVGFLVSICLAVFYYQLMAFAYRLLGALFVPAADAVGKIEHRIVKHSLRVLTVVALVFILITSLVINLSLIFSNAFTVAAFIAAFLYNILINDEKKYELKYLFLGAFVALLVFAGACLVSFSVRVELVAALLVMGIALVALVARLVPASGVQVKTYLVNIFFTCLTIVLLDQWFLHIDLGDTFTRAHPLHGLYFGLLSGLILFRFLGIFFSQLPWLIKAVSYLVLLVYLVLDLVA